MALLVSFFPQGSESLWTWQASRISGTAIADSPCPTPAKLLYAVPCGGAEFNTYREVAEPFSSDARWSNSTPFTLMWIFAAAGALGLVYALSLDGKQSGARAQSS
jgi:hypothetical protein